MEGGFVDNFLCFLSLAFVLILLSFKDNRKAFLLPLLGILAGGLLATKHTGVILDAFAFLAVLVWIVRSDKKTRPWNYFYLAIALGLLISVPWYLKSWIDTGNPVYPFLYKYFHTKGPEPDILYWSNPNIERSFIEFITWIPRLTWDETIVQIHRRLLSWYFAPLLPFSIWYGIANPKARTAALLVWIDFLIVYLTAPGEPRYALMALTLFAVIGAWGVLQARAIKKLSIGYILPILLVLPIGSALVERTREMNLAIPTILGLKTVGDYYDSSLDIYPLINYINHETEPDSKIIIMDPRVFPLDRDFIIWYPFPTPLTSDWPDLSDDEIIGSWKQSGAEYILISFGPNYRAIAIDTAVSGCSKSTATHPLFSSVPNWIYLRASFAERSLKVDESGLGHLLPEFADRCDKYDVKSIIRLENLYDRGLLERVFENPSCGAVFKIVYPERSVQ